MPKKPSSKARDELIFDLDDQLKRAVEIAQRDFYDAVRDYYESQLSLDDANKVRTSAANYARLNGINNLADEFAKQKGSKISKKVAQGMLALTAENVKYFTQQIKLQNNIKKNVRSSLLARYGARVKDNKLIISKGGWLHGLAKPAAAFSRIQDIGIDAVAQGMPLQTFRRVVKQAAFDTGARTIKHHFDTEAVDVYARFDRTAQKEFADKVQFMAFIYEGGLIDTSREWCENHNGKVFLVSETEAWKTQTWAGKNKDYDPLRDMGGYNCRHHPSFISDELAIALRPELRDIFDKMDNG